MFYRDNNSAVFSMLLFITTCLFLLFISNNMYSQKLEQIADVDLISIIEKEHTNSKQANIKYSNKKNIGKFLCIESNKIIDSIVKISLIDSLENKNIIIRIEGSNTVLNYSYYDFSSNVNKITPYIILTKKAEYRYGDTINYFLKTDAQNSDADFSELDKQFNHSQVFNLFLQFPKLSDKEKYLFFDKGASLIFPLDISTARWISNPTRLKIYLIK